MNQVGKVVGTALFVALAGAAIYLGALALVAITRWVL